MTTQVRASEPPARNDRFYSAVRLVGRFWLWFFFKHIEAARTDRVPADGPVLLCINHPNNLIDSLLVGAVLDRKVHYLATAALFRNPLVARFLTACGAIPVYRKQDDPARMDRNIEAFAACFRTLEQGGLIGIYPEGTTHSESRVQRIKTGAARIALEYEAGGRGRPLALVPVGLNFEARKSFGGHVRVSFGEAIPLPAYVAAYRSDPVRAVEGLTTAIQQGMEAEVLHVARPERQELIRAVEQIYAGDLIRELQQERGLGARQIDIVRQFLIEAATLTTLGGFAGLGVGYALSRLVADYARWPTLVSPITVALSLSVSCVSGLLFGLWPAWQAARVNPIEALRSE